MSVYMDQFRFEIKDKEKKTLKLQASLTPRKDTLAIYVVPEAERLTKTEALDLASWIKRRMTDAE